MSAQILLCYSICKTKAPGMTTRQTTLSRPYCNNNLFAATLFVTMMLLLSFSSSTTFLLKGAHAFPIRRFSSLVTQRRYYALSSGRVLSHNHHHYRPRQQFIHHASSDSPDVTPDSLTMDNIYREWSLQDDKLLNDNKHLPAVRLASLLGRGMHGVEARLKKLTDRDSTAYARMFCGDESSGSDNIENDGDFDSSSDNSGKLTPVKEVLRRIQWDPTLPASSFTIVHYDRVDDTLCETPFDAPNDSISGKESQFVFALPEHRIEKVMYLDRTVWNKEMRLDCVFGSMNGKGETIDQVVATYEEWKREKDEREERNRRWQMEILRELDSILGDVRVGVLKEISSTLMKSEWDDSESVKDYVKRVVGLYHDAKREHIEKLYGNTQIEEKEIGVVDFLYLFSDLVALLENETLREEILQEIEILINRSLGEESTPSKKSNQAAELQELNDDDLEEKVSQN